MAFDLSSAQPAEGFDLSSAQPVSFDLGSAKPVEEDATMFQSLKKRVGEAASTIYGGATMVGMGASKFVEDLTNVTGRGGFNPVVEAVKAKNGFKTNEEAINHIYQSMEAEQKGITDYWNTPGAKEGFVNKLISTGATFPAQIAAMPFSAAQRGQEMIQAGETNTGKIQAAVGADAAMNALGIALPASVQGKLLTRAASGAAINAAQGAASDSAAYLFSETPEYKKAMDPKNPEFWERRALEATVGAGFGSVVGERPAKSTGLANEIKANLDALDKTKEEQAKTQGEGTLYVGKDGEVTKELPRKIEESPEQLDRARTELQNRLQEEATRNVEGPQLNLLDEEGRPIPHQGELDLQTKLNEPTPETKTEPKTNHEQRAQALDMLAANAERQGKTDLAEQYRTQAEQERSLAKEFNPDAAPSIPEGHTYRVIDPRTGKVMGTYKNITTAMRAVDRLDNEYGAARYRAERIPEAELKSPSAAMSPFDPKTYVAPEHVSPWHEVLDHILNLVHGNKTSAERLTASERTRRSRIFDDNNLDTAIPYKLKDGTSVVNPDGSVSIKNFVKAMFESDGTAKNRPELQMLLRTLAHFVGDLKIRMVPEGHPDLINRRGKEAPAVYKSVEHEIVSSPKGWDVRTMVHELVHAATVRALVRWVDTAGNLKKGAPKAVQDLHKIFKAIEKKAEKITVTNEKGETSTYYAIEGGRIYGLENIKEFAAEVMTNRYLQKIMRAEPGIGIVAKGANLLEKFKNAVASLFGSKPNEVTLLKEAIEAVEGVVHYQKEDAGNLLNWYKDHAPDASQVRSFMAEIGQKATNEDLKPTKIFDEDSAKAEAISRIAGTDHIPADPVIDDKLLAKIKGEADGSNKWALTPGALARATLANSTLVKTVYRLMNNAYKRADRFNRDVVQPVEKTFGKILQNDQKSQIIHDILMRELKKGVDYTADELRSAGVSDDLITAHLEFRNMMQQALDKQNQVLLDKGLPPVKGIDAYLSARWSGPWRASIKDADGKIIFQVAEHNRRTAQRAIDAIKEKFPNLKYDDLAYKQRMEKGDNIEAGYLDMLKLLDPNDERVATLKSIYEDIVTGRTEDVGAQEKHFLKKTGVRGFAGDRPWSKTDARDMFIQQFEYAKNAGRWAESQKAVEGVNKLINNPELQESQKNNIAYSKEYTKNQLGFGTSKFFETLDNGIAKALGTSPQELQKYMGGLKTVFYLTKLGLSVPFTITQLLQPAITTPAWHAQLNAEGFKHNPVMSGIVGIGKGLTAAAWHYAQALGDPINQKFAEKMMTPLQKEAATYMEANGVIDINPLADIRKNLRHDVVKAAAVPFEFTIKHSEIIARSIAFMSFVDHLEQSGKFDTTTAKGRHALFEKAEDMTNLSMTDYRSHERALAFERGGLVGDAAATLHAYQINNLMQGLKFVKEARQGNALPLFYMVAMQAVAAGMTGLWFVDDLDDLIDNMKKFLPHDQFMKVKDFSVKNLMLNNLPDWASYGLVSKATGTNINTRMNASNQIPIWPFEAAPTMRTAKDVAGYAAGQVGSMAPFAGTGLDIADAGLTGLNPGATPNEKLQALYPAMPTAAQGPMERLPQFNAGDVSLNPKDLSTGKYRRTESEKSLRDYGFRSVKEQKQQDQDYALGKVERQMTQRLTDAGKSAKEYALSGKGEKAAEEAIKYTQLGGDPETLFSGLDQAILKKFTTELDRRVIGAGTGTKQSAEKLLRYLKSHGYQTN